MMETVDEALAQLRDPDPQKRGEAARWLGSYGDTRALVALEHLALFDGEDWDDGRDGDRVGSTACQAIYSLSRRVFTPTEADCARIAEWIVRSPELEQVRRESLERIVGW